MRVKVLKNFINKKTFFALIVAISIFWIWHQRTNNAKSELHLTSPLKRDLTQTLEITGVVNAHEIANLNFSSGGRLGWVGVKEGDYVKKWQPIASLDTRQLQKQLEQDLNNFNKAIRNRDQTLDDNDAYGNSPKDREIQRILENANFDLKNSALNVEIRDLAVKLSSLVSPISGIVTRIDNPFTGSNISINDTFQIINFDTLYFQAYADEEDVPKLVENMPASIILDAFTDQPFESSISAIARVSTNTDTGTGYEVEFPLDKSGLSNSLRIGMNGTAQIILDKKDNVLSVEVDALILRDGQLYVEVMQAGEIVQTPIEVGIETDDYAEIISGIDESSQVILPTQ